jgi:hypothetical protein
MIDLTWLTGLFPADEVKSLLWIFATILTVVHTIKILWRIAPGIGPAPVWALVLLSIGVSMVAALHLWDGKDVHPLIVGAVCGPLANMLFWSVGSPLKTWAPWLWRMIQIERRAPRPAVPEKDKGSDTA